MPTTRLFAYNSGTTISGTEQVGDIAVGVSTSLNYSQNAGGVRWWNGPDEDLGYIITHTTPSGTQPNPDNVPAYIGFWRSTSKTENSFITLTNSLFGTSYSTGNQCKTYLNNNGYWTSFTSDPNLKLHLDASNPNSYSGTGTTWYDLSSNGNDVQMSNSGSISWVSTGATYFSTGSNGWFSNSSGVGIPTGNTPYTFIIWVQLGLSWSSNGFMSIGTFGVTNQSNAFRAGSTNQLINYWWGNDLAVNSSVSPANDWFNAVVKYDGITRSILVNGVLVGSDTPIGHNVTNNTLQIAKTYSNEYLNGNVGEVLIYDIALSDSDILEYYDNTKSRYATPVLGNIVLYYDPSNLSSYSGSGTTINDLSGNGRNGTMTNISFTSPYFTYNGSSSRVSIADNALLEPGSGSWTMEVWVNQSVSGNDVVLGKFDNGGLSIDVSYSIRTTGTAYYAQIGSGSGSGSNLFVNSTTYTGSLNTWYQIVYVFKNGGTKTLETFVNGVSIGSVNHSLPSILNSTNPLYLGSYNGGEFPQWFDGKIGITRLYNTSLTSTQVLQNFNADKSKYGI